MEYFTRRKEEGFDSQLATEGKTIHRRICREMARRFQSRRLRGNCYGIAPAYPLSLLPLHACSFPFHLA